MRPNGSENAGDTVRPDRPRRHRDRRDAGHRPRRSPRASCAAGAKVVVASRKADACAETEAYLTDDGWRGARRARPTSASSTRSRPWSTRTVDRFGRLDIVVNNAANALTQPLGALHARGVGQVVRREPARARCSSSRRRSRTSSESPYGAVVNVLSAGAFLLVDERADVLGGQGRHARVHPVDGRRLRAVRASA